MSDSRPLMPESSLLLLSELIKIYFRQAIRACECFNKKIFKLFLI